MSSQPTKAVRLKDSHNTIILIEEGEDAEKARQKYAKDLNDYKYRTEKYLTKEKINSKI